jgi:hypothetical protein
MGVLDKLDSVDWPSIHHSHGTSEKFPYFLRKLAQNDAEEWEAARHYIREYSNHQDTIYEVTPYVAPFLIELLQTLPASRAADLLDILANYAWSLQNQHGQTWFEIMQQRGEFGRIKSVEDTRAILEKNLDLFLPYLDNDDPRVRAPAAELLFQFREAPKISEALERRRQVETDDYVKQTLELGFQV